MCWALWQPAVAHLYRTALAAWGLGGLCLPSVAESSAANAVGIACFSQRRQCALHQGAQRRPAACTVVGVGEPSHSSPRPQLSRVLVAVSLARWEPVISAAPPPVNTWGSPTCMWAAAYNTPMVWRGLVVSRVCLLLHSAHQQTLRQPTQVVTAVPAWAFLQKGPAVLSLSQPCHADTAMCLRATPASPCSPLWLKLPHGAVLCLQCSQHQPGFAGPQLVPYWSAPCLQCSATSLSQALPAHCVPSSAFLGYPVPAVQPASATLWRSRWSPAVPHCPAMCLQRSQHSREPSASRQSGAAMPHSVPHRSALCLQCGEHSRDIKQWA